MPRVDDVLVLLASNQQSREQLTRDPARFLSNYDLSEPEISRLKQLLASTDGLHKAGPASAIDLRDGVIDLTESALSSW